MADIKTKYPSTSSVAVTISLVGLPQDTTLLAGQSSLAVDNTANLDLDHLVSGYITPGGTPALGNVIEVWAYASYKTAAGTPSYPDTLVGTDAAKTISSLNVKQTTLRQVAVIPLDAATSRNYFFAPVSIAQLFGSMPKFWGLFVTHNSGSALNASAINHSIHYERVQAQTV